MQRGCMDILKVTDTFLIKAMRKRDNKRTNQIKALAIMLALAYIVLELIIITGINYGLFIFEQRLIIVCLEMLILVVGFFVLRRLFILFALNNNPPKEKQRDLIIEETSRNDPSEFEHTYYVFFDGNNKSKDLLERVLDDTVFQDSITFYSKELVNIMWELKEGDDIVCGNDHTMVINDISSLLDEYKDIMTSFDRKGRSIDYVRDGMVERSIRFIGKTLEIRSNRNEYDALKSLFGGYGFEIGWNGECER